MIYVQELSFACVVTALCYYLASTIAALMFVRRSKRKMPALPKVAPRVAVLKPLHGLTYSLVENLVTYLENSYPRAEYYFGVSGYDDRAAEVPVVLRTRYQFSNITLVIGEEPGCTNHKVGALIKMADRASKAEIFVLSDADVSVSPDHLRRLVGELIADDRVGIVTCAYRARPIGTFASRLEALFVNTDFLPQALLSSSIERLRHAFGATIAIKREALEAIGGFRALQDVLADDYYIGNKAAKAGWRVRLSSSLVTVACEEKTFGEFWRHQLRWARTYRTARPVSLATIVTHGPFWALVGFFASIGTPFSLLAFWIMLAVFGARIAMSALLLNRVVKLKDLTSDLALVPVRDLLSTAIWFASLLSNKVVWAGRRFKVRRDGAMRELKA
jgi:ceramide glucosyltransferase